MKKVDVDKAWADVETAWQDLCLAKDRRYEFCLEVDQLNKELKDILKATLKNKGQMTPMQMDAVARWLEGEL